jgi:hypothetical protein
MSPAMATCPQEFTARWHSFWQERAPLQAEQGRRVSYGDTWATVRDRNGRLVEQFTINATAAEIDYRLAQLQLDEAV